jgi:hypothetical protein
MFWQSVLASQQQQQQQMSVIMQTVCRVIECLQIIASRPAFCCIYTIMCELLTSSLKK